jgi:hypothetical protein
MHDNHDDLNRINTVLYCTTPITVMEFFLFFFFPHNVVLSHYSMFSNYVWEQVRYKEGQALVMSLLAVSR